MRIDANTVTSVVFRITLLAKIDVTNDSILIGDIGGTNARLALAARDDAAIRDLMAFRCDEFSRAEALIEHYLQFVEQSRPSAICLAAAGPVVGDSIRLTNGTWTLDAGDISATFDGARVFLLNDFDAVAYALPLLNKEQRLRAGGPPLPSLDTDSFTLAAVGPGTGLGTAALQRSGDVLISIGGEAGLSGFAPVTDEQMAIAATLRERLDRVATEHLVSGPGLVNLYWALAKIHGEAAEPPDAAEIGERAQNRNDPIAVAAMRIFFEVLGQYAGDVALMFGALDGVYIAGGIARRYPKMLLDSTFRDAFEMKTPHTELMRTIPTQLITHEEPGLLGAADYARREIGSG